MPGHVSSMARLRSRKVYACISYILIHTHARILLHKQHCAFTSQTIRAVTCTYSLLSRFSSVPQTRLSSVEFPSDSDLVKFDSVPMVVCVCVYAFIYIYIYIYVFQGVTP